MRHLKQDLSSTNVMAESWDIIQKTIQEINPVKISKDLHPHFSIISKNTFSETPISNVFTLCPNRPTRYNALHICPVAAGAAPSGHQEAVTLLPKTLKRVASLEAVKRLAAVLVLFGSSSLLVSWLFVGSFKCWKEFDGLVIVWSFCGSMSFWVLGPFDFCCCWLFRLNGWFLILDPFVCQSIFCIEIEFVPERLKINQTAIRFLTYWSNVFADCCLINVLPVRMMANLDQTISNQHLSSWCLWLTNWSVPGQICMIDQWWYNDNNLKQHLHELETPHPMAKS